MTHRKTGRNWNRSAASDSSADRGATITALLRDNRSAGTVTLPHLSISPLDCDLVIMRMLAAIRAIDSSVARNHALA